MMTVKFKNVGRNDASWSAECSEKDFTYDWFIRQINRNAKLASRYIEIDYENDENGKPSHGKIFAGFHAVGEFTVEGA